VAAAWRGGGPGWRRPEGRQPGGAGARVRVAEAKKIRL
jgi:hypothetical protein